MPDDLTPAKLIACGLAIGLLSVGLLALIAFTFPHW